MESKTINVVSCTLKADKGSFKIYTITDTDGTKYDSFAELEAGEHEVDITPNENPAFPAKIKKKASAKKAFVAGQKDYTFEKRKFALEMARSVESVSFLDSILATAERIEKWLNR